MSWWARTRAAWRSIDRQWLDGGLAALLAAQIWAGLAAKSLEVGQQASTPLAYVLAGLAAAPFAVHRRYPLVAAAVMDVAVVLYALGQFSAYPGLPVFVLVFATALHCGRRSAVLTFAAAVVTMSIALLLQPGTVATLSTWVATALALAVAWLSGENRRGRRARWLALEERARHSEAEREQRAREAVVQERLRIARELHDVVAHSMSVIAVQSGVGHHLIDSRPEEARKALATIESTSRSALAEMRRLLGVLRQGDQSHGELAPAPGLADVPALVDRVRGAGVAVDLRLELDGEEPPSGVQLSAYRVVQEGLTNVLRHGGSTAQVVVRRVGSTIEVEVTDDGRRAWAQGRPINGSDVNVAPANGPRARTPGAKASDASDLEPGGGHGLIGVRERVAVFGGEFSAGPRPGGGYRLAATLPMRGDT